MHIRKMIAEDIEPLYDLISNAQVMEYIEPVYSKEKAEAFLLSAGLSKKPLIYAVEDDGRFIGYVIYHDYDNESIEIGWLLYPECWNKGFASNLTRMLIEKAFSENKDVVIECHHQQEVSRHIANKYGFRYEGKIDNLDVFRLRR